MDAVLELDDLVDVVLDILELELLELEPKAPQVVPKLAELLNWSFAVPALKSNCVFDSWS